MTHEEYLEANSKVRKYVKLNTKKADLLSLKAKLNEGGYISIVGKDGLVRDMNGLDMGLHENIKEVVNIEIGKLVESIIIEMNNI